MTDETLDKARRLKQQIVLIQEAQKIVDDPNATAAIIIRGNSGYTFSVGQSNAVNGKVIEENVLHDTRILLHDTLILLEDAYRKL
jgi:hypothetical protein